MRKIYLRKKYLLIRFPIFFVFFNGCLLLFLPRTENWQTTVRKTNRTYPKDLLEAFLEYPEIANKPVGMIADDCLMTACIMTFYLSLSYDFLWLSYNVLWCLLSPLVGFRVRGSSGFCSDSLGCSLNFIGFLALSHIKVEKLVKAIILAGLWDIWGCIWVNPSPAKLQRETSKESSGTLAHPWVFSDLTKLLSRDFWMGKRPWVPCAVLLSLTNANQKHGLPKAGIKKKTKRNEDKPIKT